MKNGKEILVWILVIFGAYAVLTDPVDSADTVDGVLDFVVNGFQNILVFFDRLLAD
jgi:hypothetical protein